LHHKDRPGRDACDPWPRVEVHRSKSRLPLHPEQEHRRERKRRQVGEVPNARGDRVFDRRERAVGHEGANLAMLRRESDRDLAAERDPEHRKV
jgi:hypothetical protein